MYCRRLGVIDAQLTNFGIPVSDRLDRLARPDVIHGNSPIETAAAILNFPDTPAIFVCHGWDSPDAIAPRMPSIMRYLAVSDISRDRLIYFDGVPEQLIGMHYNPVDLLRFPRRPPLPDTPRRALVFSNTITEANVLGIVEEACIRAGISLDTVGQGFGNTRTDPEHVLSDYDIVFARGRCALEAIATGCAVILCDALGIGELITTENYEMLRLRNFGRRSLQLKVETQSLVQQVQRYNPADAAAVTDMVREREGLYAAANTLVDIYRDAIETFEDTHVRDCVAERRATARFLEAIAPTSNTFFWEQHLEPLNRRAREAEGKIKRLERTLAMARLSDVELSAIQVANLTAPSTMPAGSRVQASIRAGNRTSKVLSSLGEYPVHISYHWLSENGAAFHYEGTRTELFPPLPPAADCEYIFSVETPPVPGAFTLRATLVQERVSWLDTYGAYCDQVCTILE